METITISRWSFSRSKALILIVYSLVVMFYITGLYQKLYYSEDARIRIHAIPIAISTLYQGHKHDYRGWRSTALPFQSPHLNRLKDKFINERIQFPVNKDEGHYNWVADDRGYADFVIGAFALFGPHMKSLYHFWFLIFLISITLFILSFKKHPWALAFAALLILGVHSAAMLLKLIHVECPLFEPRYLDVLSLFPMFHLIFAAVFLKKEEIKKHLFLIIGQLIIFLFLYHARLSLSWQIVAIIGASLSACLIRRKLIHIIPAISVVILLFGGLISLNIYKHLTYHKSYFQEMGVRTIWHNALMGLHIKEFPENAVCDFAIAKVVINYARNSNLYPTSIQKLEPQQLLNTLGGYGTADWVAYENCAKKFYWTLVMQNKWSAFKLYLFQKPKKLLSDLHAPIESIYGKLERMKKNKISSNPLHLIYLIPFAFILFLSADALYAQRKKLLGVLTVVFLSGMIPSIIFYTCILTRGGLSATAVVLFYLIITVLAYMGYKWIRDRILTRRFNRYETQ